ncbi:cyclin-like protein [Echria macrotheca]|uniref:RNA polymerase II holoenzyme cyclin-like subunit n=1 Tax=Echria macrotheca TaxID=438768 RepID=A0AAJ0BFU0_9PEZI|nr:cyclin-like protein [Echria macrotheca]
MSNIDRYRPQREGYQPPSLPPKPPPSLLDRPSKSPSRRRDVPPAVPSPPTHSSRTSPPRPHSRRSAPSPQASPQRTTQAPPGQWFFTTDEVASTPAIVEGLSLADERLRRTKGVNFIYQAGILLHIPQTTLWVAAVFFHRFFMRYSIFEEKGGIHHYNIAATSLFLANKTEENCRKTKDVIIAVARVAQKNAKLIIDEQSKEYWRWRDSILTYEEVMLEMLTFDLMVDVPYNRLYEQLEQLEMIHDKDTRDAAWAFCNDAALTVLPLLMTARDIAISSIHFAAAVRRLKIDDVRGEAWWRVLGGNETLIGKAINVMCDFYEENPLRKQDKKLPGSPEFNLESTRRRGEHVDMDSNGGTPFGTDRGTQSPRFLSSQLNGKTEQGDIRKEEPALNKKDEAVIIKKEEPAVIKNEDGAAGELEAAKTSQMSRGDSDAALKVAANDLSLHERTSASGGLRSPVLPSSKRKSEMDLDSDVEREVKRARTVDEDEGEIRGS